MLLFWACLLLLITLYLQVVNKCSSEAPESYHLVCVDVVAVVCVVVIVVVGNVYFAIYSITIRLEAPEIAKRRDKHWVGGQTL